MNIELKRNSLKKNFSWNFLGTLIYSLTQWGLIVVLTRLGTVEMAGLYSLGLAITGPIIMFTNLQLRTIQATSREEELNFSYFFSVRLLSIIAFTFVLFFIISIGEYNQYSVLIICLVGLSRIIESLSDLTYGFFQQKERMELIAKSTMMRGTVSLTLVIVLLYITSKLYIALFGLIISWFVIWVLYDMKNIKKFSINIKPEFYWNEILKIIIISLPLGIVSMIVSLNINLPRILVEKLIDVEALGFFAGIAYLVYIGSKFINTVGNAMLPRLSILYIEGEIKKYNQHLFLLVAISAIIGIILTLMSVFFGELILNIVYGSEFIPYKNILILIMLYGTFDYVSYSLMIGLNALKAFKIQPYLGIFWLTVTTIALIILLPKYGLVGAAFALIIYSLSRVISITVVLFYSLNKRKKSGRGV